MQHTFVSSLFQINVVTCARYFTVGMIDLTDDVRGFQGFLKLTNCQLKKKNKWNILEKRWISTGKSRNQITIFPPHDSRYHSPEFSGIAEMDAIGIRSPIDPLHSRFTWAARVPFREFGSARQVAPLVATGHGGRGGKKGAQQFRTIGRIASPRSRRWCVRARSC